MTWKNTSVARGSERRDNPRGRQEQVIRALQATVRDIDLILNVLRNKKSFKQESDMT